MIRVVIRKPLHPYLEQLAKALQVDDMGEVVNWLILQHKMGQAGIYSEATPSTAINHRNDDLDELQGLL